MKKADYDLYTDYLLSTFGAATATGLSALVDGEVSHDQVTRFLSKRDFTSKDLWMQVKSTVRDVESETGVLIFDDTIQEKAWTDENDLICWHFDHCRGRNVKGINLLNALYYSKGVSMPVGFELITKPVIYSDLQTQQVKRKSEITKNELLRQMLAAAVNNQIKFQYVLMDSWFSAKENFVFIRKKGKHFISALKSNRLVAQTEKDKQKKCFTRIDDLNFPEEGCVRAWIKGYPQEVLLVRQVFTNKDGSTGILYLACSDLDSDYNTITTTYKKRWKVEVFYKSLKSNAALSKSPTKTMRTQSNHIFMSLCAAFKLECLSVKRKLNLFTLSRKLLINATKAAYDELHKMRLAA